MYYAVKCKGCRLCRVQSAGSPSEAIYFAFHGVKAFGQSFASCKCRKGSRSVSKGGTRGEFYVKPIPEMTSRLRPVLLSREGWQPASVDKFETYD